MRELALQWYVLLGALNATVAYPIRAAGDAAGIPALSALLFGLIGATAPCQLTTGAGALAYLARGSAAGRAALLRNAGAYVLAKALVYTVLGLAVVVAGRQVLPVVAIATIRRVLGPLMVLMGLRLLGLLPLHFDLGSGASAWLRARAGDGAAGAFLLGGAFGLAFCPTLFLLFFGLTLPLALASPGGVVFPALFALGTSLPLVVLAAALGAGGRRPSARSARHAARWLQPAAGAVLLLVGISDTLTYWLV